MPEVGACPSGGFFLDLGDPVVPWRVRVFPVKFSEFIQTTYRKVVEWLFHPVPSVRVTPGYASTEVEVRIL